MCLCYPGQSAVSRHISYSTFRTQHRVERDLLNSRIVALVLESMLYGVFTVTYCIGVGKLLRGNQPNRVLKRNRMLLVVNTVMFGLATTVRGVESPVLVLSSA